MTLYVLNTCCLGAWGINTCNFMSSNSVFHKTNNNFQLLLYLVLRLYFRMESLWKLFECILFCVRHWTFVLVPTKLVCICFIVNIYTLVLWIFFYLAPVAGSPTSSQKSTPRGQTDEGMYQKLSPQGLIEHHLCSVYVITTINHLSLLECKMFTSEMCLI